MEVALAILILCLLVLAVTMRVGGAVLLFVSLFLAIVLIITMLVRFSELGLRRRRLESPNGSAGGANPDDNGAGRARACPNPHCGQVNEERARFCARCGEPLR